MEFNEKRIEMTDAFPNEFASISCRGMTLRDYFAAKAMQGILSLYSEPGNVKRQNDNFPHELPKLSYSIADAMLKEREKE